MVRERGSVLPIVVVVVLATAVSTMVLVGLAGRAVQAADAQTAADMAALAAVFEGRAGAADLAERNGAELVQYHSTSLDVHVVVALGGASAEASAVYETYVEGPGLNQPGG